MSKHETRQRGAPTPRANGKQIEPTHSSSSMPFSLRCWGQPFIPGHFRISPGNFRNSPGNFRNSPGNFRNSPALYFQFQGQKDILRETPGKPGHASRTTCPGKGVPQRIPAQSVAVILSIAPGFSSTASSQAKIWNDGVTRRIPKSHIKNMLARQRLLRQQKV